MDRHRSGPAWTLIGAAVLAITVGAMARRSIEVPKSSTEEMRDAVASPVSPALLGGARVVQPNAGYFASPAERRAEAERALSPRAMKGSKAMRVRAAKRRLAARERALTVPAQ